jgi:hypothetical protein
MVSHRTDLGVPLAIIELEVYWLCLQNRNRTWIGSVQGAVATWSAISMRHLASDF